MKRVFAIFGVLLISLTVFTACGKEAVSNDYHLKMTFPDYMSVFAVGTTAKDDPAFDGQEFNYEALQAFANEDGVFYAIGEKDGITREFSVTVSESDYSKQLWQLKKEDTATVNEWEEDMISQFNENGYTVRQKGEFSQGDAYCIFLTIEEGNGNGYDTVYMFTVFNGLHYAVMYRSSKDISDSQSKECFDAFDSFFITETLASPDEEPADRTVAKAVLILVLILIAVAVVFVVFRLFTHRNKEEKQPVYVSQFDDDLKSTERKDKK